MSAYGARSLGIGGAMVVLAVMAGCGGDGQSAAQADCEGGVGDTPSGELDLWVHESSGNEVVQELLDDYMDTYPGVTVEMLETPYVDFETASLQATSAGDGPDLIRLPSWSLPNWADKGLLVEGQPEMFGFEDREELEAAFEPGSLDGVTFGDEVFALPVDYQNLMLFYNRDHFEEAGLDPEAPPETWEDVVDVGEQLTERSGSTITRAGFSWWYAPPIWLYQEVESLAAQLGGSVLNADSTEGALDTDAGRAAVEYYVGMEQEHNISSLDLVPNGILEAFADGDVSMFVSGAWSDLSFTALTDGDLSLEAGTLGVAPMPTFADAVEDVTLAYSWGWGVTDNAEDPCLAGHLARFLTEPEQADRLFAEIGVATPYSGFADSEAANANEANRLLVEQVSKGVFASGTPAFAEVMTTLAQQIEAGTTGTKSTEQVIEDFDDAMRRVLR